MTPEEKITKAVVQIALHQPFWATLLYKIPRIASLAVPTAATDGSRILYNPKFIDTLSPRQVQTLLAHEVAHVIMKHPLRRGSRDPMDANRAADYAINPLLKEAGFEPIEGWLYEDRFKGRSMEDIYTILQSEKQGNEDGDDGEGGGNQPDPNGQQGQGDGNNQPDPNGQPNDGDGDGDGDGQPNDGDGGGEGNQPPPDFADPGKCGGFFDPTDDKGNPLSEAEKRELESEIDIAVRQAATMAKRAGKLPAGLEELVEDFLQPIEDWREILSRYVGAVGQEDFSWSRPHRAHTHRGIYLPTLHSETFGKVVIAIDTSGSVCEDDVRRMVSEAMATLACYSEEPELVVVCCDTKVQSVQTITEGTPVKIKGGGGTSYRPVMEWLASNPPELEEPPVALIYHTDGYCSDFGDEPDGIPVLWVLSGDHVSPRRFTESIPFGEVTVLSNE